MMVEVMGDLNGSGPLYGVLNDNTGYKIANET